LTSLHSHSLSLTVDVLQIYKPHNTHHHANLSPPPSLLLFLSLPFIFVDADIHGCLVRDSTNAEHIRFKHVWVLHSDGTRNWVSKPTVGCYDKAHSVPNITVYSKRDDCSGDYDLSEADSASACQNGECTVLPDPGNPIANPCPDAFHLQAERTECDSKSADQGYVDTVQKCAEECQGKGAWFIFGLDTDGNTRCNADGCKCWCEPGDEVTKICTHETNTGYNLYNFDGMPNLSRDPPPPPDVH
jgi:hypothetical protein